MLRQLYLHVFDIKASIFAHIEKIFSDMPTDASKLCKFMEKCSQNAQIYLNRVKVPLLSEKTNFLTCIIA